MPHNFSRGDNYLDTRREGIMISEEAENLLIREVRHTGYWMLVCGLLICLISVFVHYDPVETGGLSRWWILIGQMGLLCMCFGAYFSRAVVSQQKKGLS